MAKEIYFTTTSGKLVNNYDIVGNYFPYVDDIVKYPLTALPVMYEVSEGN